MNSGTIKSPVIIIAMFDKRIMTQESMEGYIAFEKENGFSENMLNRFKKAVESAARS